MEPIGAVLGHKLLSALVAGAEALAKMGLRARFDREKLRAVLDAADSYLLSRLTSAELTLVRAIDDAGAKQVAFAILDLANDLEGNELRASLKGALEAADPMRESRHSYIGVADALFDATLKALAASDLVVSSQARILLTRSEGQTNHASLAQRLQQVLAVTSSAEQLSVDLSKVLAPVVESPIAVTQRAQRSAVAHEFAGHCTPEHWFAVHGPAGSGKTQLVVRTTEVLGAEVGWIQLRGLSADQAADKCRNARVLSLSRLNTPAVLVVDDLPRVTEGGALASELVRVLAVAQARRSRVISISGHRLPSELTVALAAIEKPCPQLTKDDVREVLELHGCPTGRAVRLAQFCHSMSRGNGLLLRAIVRYLSRLSWDTSLDTIGRVLEGDHQEELSSELVRRVLDTVSDQDGRRLLYRLRLVLGAFDRGKVSAVANVVPRVSFPREAFLALEGVWIEELADDSWRLAAVLSALPTDCLSDAEQRATHMALAAELIRAKTLSPDKALELVVHFVGGRNVSAGLSVLTTALTSLYTHKDVTYHAGLLDPWGTTPLPPEFPVGPRIFLCALQLVLRHRFGLNATEKGQELDDLSTDLDPTAAGALLLVTSMFARELLRDETALMARILNRALQGRDRATQPDGTPFAFPDDIKIVALPFIVALWVTDVSHAACIAQTLAGLSRDDIASLGGDRPVNEGIFALVELPCRRPDAACDWSALTHLLSVLQELGDRIGLEDLKYRALRRRALIVGEKLTSLDAARELLNAEPSTALGRLAANDARARLCLLAGDKATAVLHFENALATESSTESLPLSWQLDWISAALDASFAEQAVALAVPFLQRALAKSRSVEGYDEVNRVRILGELALAFELLGRWNESKEALEEGMRTLASQDNTDLDTRQVSALLWNVVSFVATETCYGGAESRGLKRPPRGFMFEKISDVDAVFTPRRRALAELFLAVYCRCAGDDEAATLWVTQADSSSKGGLEDASVGYALFKLPLLVAGESPLEALSSDGTGEPKAFLTLALILLPFRVALAADRDLAAKLVDALALLGEASADAREAAALFGMFANSAGPDEFRDRVTSANNHHVRMLLASVDQRLSYEDAFRLQVGALRYIGPALRAASGAAVLVVAPALAAFWRQAVTRSGFRFVVPTEVIRELDRVPDLAPKERLGHILRTVASGLSFNLRPEENFE